MIRQRLLKAGFSSRTVRRYLPQEAKQQQQVHSKKVAKMSTYHQELELKPEQYDTQALESYDKSFLIQIIRYLEQKQTVKEVAHEVKQITATTRPVIIKPVQDQQAKNYYSPQLDANSPRQVCVNQCLTILQEKQSLTFEDLIKQACQQSKQAAAYIGNNYLTKHNYKLRPILQQLLDHGSISRTGQHPVVLSWTG